MDISTFLKSNLDALWRPSDLDQDGYVDLDEHDRATFADEIGQSELRQADNPPGDGST